MDRARQRHGGFVKLNCDVLEKGQRTAIEGYANRSMAETRPEVVALARRLRHTRTGRKRSLREISAELAVRGFVAEKTGRPFEAAQVSRMLEGAAKS